MSTVYSMPSVGGIRRVRFGLRTNTLLGPGALSGDVGTKALDGARWFAEYELPPMARAVGQAWAGFLAGLNGRTGRFYGYDPSATAPRGIATGTPLVKGASQTGTSLITDGWTRNATGILKTGDYIAFETPSGGRELHKLTADASTTAWVSQATGSVTLANMRLSIVNGTAFVDFSTVNALTPYADGYHKLIITDSAGKQLIGYIKAAGAGETLSATDIFSDPAFDTDASWTKTHANWTVAGGKAQAAAAPAGHIIYQARAKTSGALYKFVITCDSYTSGNYSAYFEGGSLTTVTGTGTKSWYSTATNAGGNHGIRAMTLALTATFTDISLKQVTLPSATGVTIVSAAGGSTRNWESETSGFNRNDSSGYTYTISLQGQVTLSIAPAIRESPADNAALILSSPSCIMRLATDEEAAWDVDSAKIYGLRFAAEEIF